MYKRRIVDKISMSQEAITSQEEFEAAKTGNGVFEKDAKEKMATPPVTFDPEADKDKYFKNAADDTPAAAGGPDKDTGAGGDRGGGGAGGGAEPGAGGGAGGGAGATTDHKEDGTKPPDSNGATKVKKALDEVLLIMTGIKKQDPVKPDDATKGVELFYNNYKELLDSENSDGLGGGRRRTKRKSRKGAKKSKKSSQSQNGGRSRKNRRKHSHRRKH